MKSVIHDKDAVMVQLFKVFNDGYEYEISVDEMGVIAVEYTEEGTHENRTVRLTFCPCDARLVGQALLKLAEGLE